MTIDIFDSENWHPANRPKKEVESKKEKSVSEMNSKEQRAYFKQRAEDAR